MGCNKSVFGKYALPPNSLCSGYGEINKTYLINPKRATLQRNEASFESNTPEMLQYGICFHIHYIE